MIKFDAKTHLLASTRMAESSPWVRTARAALLTIAEIKNNASIPENALVALAADLGSRGAILNRLREINVSVRGSLYMVATLALFEDPEGAADSILKEFKVDRGYFFKGGKQLFTNCQARITTIDGNPILLKTSEIKELAIDFFGRDWWASSEETRVEKERRYRAQWDRAEVNRKLAYE